MIAVLDLDGDGYISQDDFYQKLAKPKWGLWYDQIESYFLDIVILKEKMLR